jgi:hypothetical protein
LGHRYESRCSKFQRLLLVRTWRVDRMLVAAKQYIIESIGTIAIVFTSTSVA